MKYRAQRDVAPLPDAVGERLRTAKFVVQPGFTSKPVTGPETGEDIYPSGTGDFMKLIRERGATIDYVDPDAPRVTMSLYAAEYWVPILVLVRDVLVSVEGDLIVDAIREWIRGGRPHDATAKESELEASESREPVLHIKIGAADLDAQTIEWFEASGSREDVLEGLRTFREE